MVMDKPYKNYKLFPILILFHIIVICGISFLIIGLSVSDAFADVDRAYQYLNAVMDKYAKSNTNDLRFLESYEMSPNDPEHKILEDTAYVYDNAIVMLAYLQRKNPEDVRQAKIIADSFVYVLHHDRYYHDGRVRNAYSAKKLINSDTGYANLPGSWDPITMQWHENKEQVSSHTGNMAWVIIALSQFHKSFGGDHYKTAAVMLGNWIYNNTYDGGGYTGGSDGWEAEPVRISYKSTENNLDVFIAFKWLQTITGDPVWGNRALIAKNFVETMWSGNHFWIGTQNDGRTPEKNNPPLDIQAWSVLAFKSYFNALKWAEKYCYTECDGFQGFDFNTDKDGIWFEGTAQITLAYIVDNQKDKANKFLNELRRAQICAHNHNGKGIVAASHDNVSTGLDWNYFSRLHIGATSWYIFAELNYNPFTGTVIK